MARFTLATLLLFLLITVGVSAQTHVKKYTVKNGKMFIELSKDLTAAAVDSFIVQFDLKDLGLKHLFKNQSPDSLQQQGWQLEKNTPGLYVISKPLMGLEHLENPAEKIMLTGKQPDFENFFPAVNSNVRFGYNRFKNKAPFAVQDSTVTFYLRNYTKANQVKLAGSFNNWSPTAQSMIKTDSGWVAQVKLKPGKYWYKFVVDHQWVLDGDNQIKENDGRGNTNSVFFVPNTLFSLPGFTQAKRVYLAGSFNNWREKELLMQKKSDGWALPLYLAEGTHTYKFIADGNWHHDRNNKDSYPDEFGGVNSVKRFGTPQIFRLNGFPNARTVILAGSFNNWREDELYLTNTATGWEIPYTLGPGNYEYKFKVDGQWVKDPLNPLTVENFNGSGNSYLIIQPNYTFRLKGHGKARSVYLAGDFNGWSPTALPMKKEGDDWVFSVHLPLGKNRYKFVVDGEWIIDPSNKLWEQNEHHTGNSILWIE
ncbi:glycogen-binding domain-containing protein [Rufibacter roseus]|uniref:glycogen-binding domain-containing protein n=1 Tax=Rufibacter roseus TaxID=1567108 RepID=UPI0013735017|nr:glycogen-binding domain-containing protein [Rufibacter roseus]